MRTIKFRFYKVPTNKMTYTQTFESWDLVEDKDWKVMQFTGLIDKNGKEIYEGDILRINNEPDSNVSSIDDITNIGFLKGFIARNRPVEIIGNIYENPELLEATK